MNTSPPMRSIPLHAGERDAEELFLFLYSLRDELANGDVDPSLLSTAVRRLTNFDAGTAFIIRGETHGNIEASVGLQVDQMPLTRHCRLRALWFVVAPHARRSGHAQGLVQAAQRFADEMKRPLLVEEFAIAASTVDKKTREYGVRFASTERNQRVRFLGRVLSPVGVVFSHIPPEEVAA